MMKENNDDDDNDIDLALALGNSNQLMKTKLKNENGAGANASSRMDMAFAASDPISELVWSPHKGLSLKCADSTLSPHKRPFLLWNLGPTTTTQLLSPPQTIRSSIAIATSPLIETTPAYGHHIESTSMEEMNRADEVHANQNDLNDRDHDENNLICNTDGSSDYDAGHGNKKSLNFLPRGIRDSSFSAFCKPSSRELDGTTFISCSGRIEDIAGGSRTLGFGVAVAAEEGLPFCQEAEKEVRLANEQKSEKKYCLVRGAPLQNLESFAENDLLHLVRAEAIGQSGERLARENLISVEGSPTNSRMKLYRRKGKEKALADGNVAEMNLSNDEEDSRESVESSNSAAGLSCKKRRKRWKLEESIVGSQKRAIKETDTYSPASTSTIRHKSSFMNWISNMVKGYSRINREDDPSCRESNQHEEDISIGNKKGDGVGRRDMGFHTMFQSLYCPKIRVSKGEYSRVEESNKLVLVNKPSVQVPQIAGLTEKDKSCETNFISKENIRAPTTSENLVGLSSQLCIMPVNAAPMQEEVSEGNNASNDHIVNLSDSFYKQRNSTPENKSPEGHYNFGSLWITRLSIKNSSTSLKLDHGNQNEYEGVNYTSCTKSTHNRITVGFPKGRKTLDTRDDSNEEAVDESASRKEAHVHKLNSVLPSPKYKKSSDAMASVFARRLDALKHISPSSDLKNETSSRKKTCLFCGRHGHDLRYCPDTTESDLAALLKNINSYASIKGSSSCLCLVCFKLDHWANTCPVRSSRKRQKIASSVGDGNAKYCSSILGEKGGQQPLNADTQISLICNFVGKQMPSDVPKGMFEAIRKLHLSRMEILKWMDSTISVSHLDGFFVRLRLRKWEAGQGGTAYHVACITGGENENSVKDSKNHISVNVGGMQCLVGIQYVSNHEFLEDEIVAWWCRSLRNGAKVPSKQGLKSKCQERMKFVI